MLLFCTEREIARERERECFCFDMRRCKTRHTLFVFMKSAILCQFINGREMFVGGSGVAQRFSAKDDVLVLFQGQGDNSFVEVYNGLNRQYRVSRLTASTRYLFRLAAINGMGKRCYILPSPS